MLTSGSWKIVISSTVVSVLCIVISAIYENMTIWVVTAAMVAHTTALIDSHRMIKQLLDLNDRLHQFALDALKSNHREDR